MSHPSGVITLTTDFGHKGPYAATMKGVVLRRFPDARIIDLTHDIEVHWPAEAGFWLSRAYSYFPEGTVHLAVVDPGVGTARDILAVQSRGHVFLAPNNGLLGELVAGDPQARCFRFDPSRGARFGLTTPSATFHGRDIFAPLAAELARGAIAPHDLGPATADIVPSWLDPPSRQGDVVQGQVVTFDHFGNVISNIDASLLEGLREPQVEAAGLVVPLLRTYGDVPPGTFLGLINAFGTVEIACAERRASSTLGIERGAPILVRPTR